MPYETTAYGPIENASATLVRSGDPFWSPPEPVNMHGQTNGHCDDPFFDSEQFRQDASRIDPEPVQHPAH